MKQSDKLHEINLAIERYRKTKEELFWFESELSILKGFFGEIVNIIEEDVSYK